MAINPDNITTIRVDQLPDGSLNLANKFAHANGTDLEKASIQDLVDLVATTIGVSGGVGFYPLAVTDGQQLPDVPENPSFFLCGAGTFLNINGYPDIVCTAELNAIMSLTDHWALAVEIPIVAEVGVQTVTGSAVDNTDPLNPIINITGGGGVGTLQQVVENGNEYTKTIGDFTYTFNIFKDFGDGGELLIDVINNVTNEQFTISGSTGGGQIYFKDIEGNTASFNLTNNASIGQSSSFGANTLKLPKKTSGSGEAIFQPPNNKPAGNYTLAITDDIPTVDVNTIGAVVNGASSATPNDTDLVTTVESSVVKKITWTNVKAFLKTYFDTIYTTASAVATQITTALTNYATKVYANDIHTSGLVSGGLVTINADPTKIDVASGTGIIVDYWTSAGNPVLYNVSWSTQTGVTVTNLGGSTQSFIAIDKTGAIVQFANRPTNAQRRDVIILAQLGHSNLTSVTNVSLYASAYDSPIEQARDIIQEFRLINDGVVITPNGANLNINRSAGYLFGLGINFRNNNKEPNRVTINSGSAISFVYRTQTGGSTTSVTAIDPTKYDLSGTVTTIAGSSNQATNQRIYLAPNGNVVIQYGQTVYTSLTNAIAGLQNENFVTYTNVSANSILIGVLCVTKGCTALNDSTNARFIPVSKFGEFIGGVAGISVSTLQNAYDNSSQPQIVTSTAKGATQIKRGSASDTDNVFEVLNGSGSTKLALNGSGNFFADYQRVNGGNANYSILEKDQLIFTGTAFTAPRVWTLPSANLPLEKREKIVADMLKTVTSTNTLTIGVQTGEYLNGVLNGTEVIAFAGGWRRFISDGNNNWCFDAGIARLSGATFTGNLNGITPTQLGYLTTLTSNVQTQLDAKQATLDNLMGLTMPTGYITTLNNYGSVSNLAFGSNAANSNNICIYQFFYTDKTITIDELYLSHTGTNDGASATVTLYFFDDNNSGLPGTLLQKETTATGILTTGSKIISFTNNITLQAGGYWIGIHVRGLNTAGSNPTFYFSQVMGNYRGYQSAAISYTNNFYGYLTSNNSSDLATNPTIIFQSTTASIAPMLKIKI